jgi:hypothetical protein
MRGLADGSGKELLDILAINVRTEINFGLFSDGCTALGWQTEKRAWLAQNWDVRLPSLCSLSSFRKFDGFSFIATDTNTSGCPPKNKT